VPRAHREIARVVAEELAERDDVLAVLLVGSAARGTEVASSDVDLLTVLTGADRKDTKPRTLRDGYLVEMWAKTETEWEERFRRAKPRWIYSFLEADVLHDTGAGARLRTAAQSAHDHYETPEQVRQELATTLRHGEPKLRRALQAGGEQAGYWASVFLPGVLDGLYAAYDRPPPAGSRRLDLLQTLPLSAESEAT
jgi:predicted nucleotidyltransferase